MKKTLSGLLLVVFAISIVSCVNDNIRFEKHESGLEFKIIEKGQGEKVKLEDVMVLNFSYEKEGGEIIFESNKSDRKYLRKVAAPSHKGGSFEDGIMLLSEGDSAVFRINAESFLRYSESYSILPKNITSEDFIIVKLRVIEIIEREEYDAIITEKFHKDKESEMAVLENYLKNANITDSPTESGIYYIEQKKGTGPKAELGNSVSVHYTLKLVDGQVIETSLDKRPFSFILGKGQVIKAWDIGIGMMREGGKAMLIVPSDLAYGEKGSGSILPYSTLIFEVELISVNK